jgi:hypothetical protein
VTPHPGESRWGDDPRPEPGDTDRQTAADRVIAEWMRNVTDDGLRDNPLVTDLRRILVAALADAREQGRAEGKALRDAVEEVLSLFAGGPDTVCRTVWDEREAVPDLGIGPLECVSVPLGDLRAVLDSLRGVLDRHGGQR